MREEFWDTRVEGSKVTWDTLKAVVEAVLNKDIELAHTIAQSAGLVVQANGQLTQVYDPLGELYKLPQYVLSDPTNVAPDSYDDGTTRDDMRRTQMI